MAPTDVPFSLRHLGDRACEIAQRHGKMPGEHQAGQKRGDCADQQSEPQHAPQLAQGLVEVGATDKVSEYVPPFVEFGVHPLLALMGLHAIYPVARKALQTKNG